MHSVTALVLGLMPEQESCLLSVTCACCTCVHWHGYPTHDQCQCELRVTSGSDPLAQSAFMHTYHEAEAAAKACSALSAVL